MSSSTFWSSCTEYSSLRVKTQSYSKDQAVYIDVRCKKWRGLPIFLKSLSEFWSSCTEYSTLRVKTQSYSKDQPVYIDMRCKKWRGLPIFLKSTVIFITIIAWCKYSRIFQCNGFRKWLEILQLDWIIKNSFSNVSRLFPHFAQRVLLVLLQAVLKGWHSVQA